jgi:hypothetical protein
VNAGTEPLGASVELRSPRYVKPPRQRSARSDVPRTSARVRFAFANQPFPSYPVPRFLPLNQSSPARLEETRVQVN